MPQGPSATRRWLTAATWPIGIGLTSWDYMWRTTPMRRKEAPGSLPSTLPELLIYRQPCPASTPATRFVTLPPA